MDYEDEYIINDYLFDTWYAVLSSYLFWLGSYKLFRIIFKQESPEYCSRVLAFFHGLFMTFLGLHQCFVANSPFENPNKPTTPIQSFILVTSLGYFIHDLLWCLYYQTETTLMVAHHIYSCFTLARILFRGCTGQLAACGLGALEITNPLLQARWFTRTHGYQHTPLFISIELTFILLFFFVRIILGSIYLILVNIQPTSTWEFRILTLLIYGMSWMFMLNIMKYFNHKYMKESVETELVPINTS